MIGLKTKHADIQVKTYKTSVTCYAFSELKSSEKFLKFLKVTIKFRFRKVLLTQHYIWKSIHSVYDKIQKKFFEVYDNDSPVGDVWPLNIYFDR